MLPSGFEVLSDGDGYRLGAGDQSGLPWVFLPGFVGDARMFAALAEQGDHRPILALNLPTDARTLQAMATGLLEQIPFPRFAIVGSSLGGLVGWAMSLQVPERIAHLVTVGSLPDHSLLPRSWDRTRWASRWSPFFGTVYRQRLRGQMGREGVHPDWIGMLTETIPSRATVLARSAAIDSWDLNGVPPVATSWLRGQVDGLAPWTAKDVQQHLPEVEFETIPGGHFAPMTHPGPFGATLRRILGGYSL